MGGPVWLLTLDAFGPGGGNGVADDGNEGYGEVEQTEGVGAVKREGCKGRAEGGSIGW